MLIRSAQRSGTSRTTSRGCWCLSLHRRASPDRSGLTCRAASSHHGPVASASRTARRVISRTLDEIHGATMTDSMVGKLTAAHTDNQEGAFRLMAQNVILLLLVLGGCAQQ